MEDFPKPECDPEVKDQLRKKGRNPQFGTKQSLFSIQEQLLEVTGPLTRLWSDTVCRFQAKNRRNHSSPSEGPGVGG